MSNPSRVTAGIPTGGQFAATQRGESDVDLSDPARGSAPSELTESLRAATAARYAAEEREQRTAMKAAATCARSLHPDADRIILQSLGDDNAYEETRFRVDTIVDADGRELADGGNDTLDNFVGHLIDDNQGGSLVPYDDTARPGEDAWSAGHSYIPIDDALAYDGGPTVLPEDVGVALNEASSHIEDAYNMHASGEPNRHSYVFDSLEKARSSLSTAREKHSTVRQVSADTVMSGDDPQAVAKQEREIGRGGVNRK